MVSTKKEFYYSWRKPHYNEEELDLVRNFFTDTEWKEIEDLTKSDSIYEKLHTCKSKVIRTQMPYNEEELDLVRDFFTDTEWKEIEDLTESDSIYRKIHILFRKYHTN